MKQEAEAFVLAGKDDLGGLAEILGMQLRDARRAAGLDQRSVADRMAKAPTLVSRVENGRALPSAEFIERYARALGRQIHLTFGLAVLADHTVRRDRVLRALFWAYDSPMPNKERYFSKEIVAALASDGAEDSTSTYLLLLERAVEDLGLYVGIGLRFKTAVAYGSACCEVIDWARVRSELAGRRGESNGDAVWSVHLRVVRRVWDVVQAAAEGRRRRAER